MKLYHGSNQLITEINLSKGKAFKDFGKGFYTTHLKEQAYFWSKRISDRFGGEPIITEFEFDFEGAESDGLNIKIFERPDEEWAVFVMNNRNTEIEFYHDFDIVIGPVADDNMARLFGLYELNVIDLEAVVKGLTYKDLNSQYFFGTETALKYIKRI